VIHHAQGIEARDRNFETLYGAYLDGHLDDGGFTFYLNRMYRMIKRENLEMESPFTSEEEINLLIEGLGLSERRAAVDLSKGK